MLTLFLMSLLAIAGTAYLGAQMFKQHQQKQRMQLQPIRIKRREPRR